MNYKGRVFVGMILTTGLLVPVALPQKPPAPAPAPAPPTPPSRNATIGPTAAQPGSSSPMEADFVMFLRGHVETTDGTALPNNTLIERICNGRVRQQVYAAPHGDFSMQMGSMADSFMDASGEGVSQYAITSKSVENGIPRRELENCELRASAGGFHSNAINLMALLPSEKAIDVGAIVLKRTEKVKGSTVSATPYKAPTDARKAYEKGMEAEDKRKLADARQYFEKAVQIYPSFAIAWFQLGNVFHEQSQKDEARAAYTKAMSLDTGLLPAYLALASLAYEAENWTEVLKLTSSILETDPFRNVSGYVVDLDGFGYGDAYFYNSVANYRLDKIDDAQRSAQKVVHRLNRFPQVHLLLAKIFFRKNDKGAAIAEMKTYLEIAPQAADAAQVREQLARLEQSPPSL